MDSPLTPLTDASAAHWDGRYDGEEDRHARWYNSVQLTHSPAEAGISIIGYVSDEGIRRNQGRIGAAAGPTALRKALANLAHTPSTLHLPLADVGDIVIDEENPQGLEEGQERLAQAVTASIQAGSLPIVLGGGHDIAYGTYLGTAQATRGSSTRIGILNLDAHFDLRQDPRPSSGTPFAQAYRHAQEQGLHLSYAVIGISEASNTQALFQEADKRGVRYLLDTQTGPHKTPQLEAFLHSFLAEIDTLYLTIDLDVLPAATAPGVSAPAAYGVSLDTIHHICQLAADSGKLTALDIAELNPLYDIDGRTAKTAARLIFSIVNSYANRKKES